MSSRGSFMVHDRAHERLSIQRGRWTRRGLSIGAHLHVNHDISGTTWSQGTGITVNRLKVEVRFGSRFLAATLFYVARIRTTHDVRSPREKQLAQVPGIDLTPRERQLARHR